MKVCIQKNNKMILVLIAVLALLFNLKQVQAETPACNTALGSYNTKIAMDEEFIFDIGTMGAGLNTYINEIYYVIEYRKDALEVVDINGTFAAAYNGWNVEAENNTNTGLNVNRITVHAYTNDRSKMYSSVVATEFVKIAYIKFKVISKEEKMTDLKLKKDVSYYSMIYQDSETSNRICDDEVINTINIYAKDGNANLSSLKVNNGEISPTFYRSITSYEVSVDNDVNTIQIDGTCSGSNCQLNGIGLKELVVGENKFTISVTAEDGTIKNYTLNVTRREKDEVYLQKLMIKNIELYPTFSSEVSNYIVNVPNETTQLEIDYITNNDNINKVEIIGNEDFIVGKNYVTIIVKNEDKNIEKSYEILVIKEDAVIEKQDNTNIYLIIIGFLAFFSIIELVIILTKRK